MINYSAQLQQRCDKLWDLWDILLWRARRRPRLYVICNYAVNSLTLLSVFLFIIQWYIYKLYINPIKTYYRRPKPVECAYALCSQIYLARWQSRQIIILCVPLVHPYPPPSSPIRTWPSCIPTHINHVQNLRRRVLFQVTIQVLVVDLWGAN